MPSDWDQHYLDGHTPWDSGIPSGELRRVLEAGIVAPGRAVELGCGTGTNAIFLAQRGFDVTAYDVSAVALTAARAKAAAAGVPIDFREADLCRLGDALQAGRTAVDKSALSAINDPGRFDFFFDRGCYHCARKVDLPGFLRTLKLLTRTGTHGLVLTGNANETTEQGPPRLTEAEIRSELGGLFEIASLREFRFEDPGGTDGPLGWSVHLIRKNDPV